MDRTTGHAPPGVHSGPVQWAQQARLRRGLSVTWRERSGVNAFFLRIDVATRRAIRPGGSTTGTARTRCRDGRPSSTMRHAIRCHGRGIEGADAGVCLVEFARQGAEIVQTLTKQILRKAGRMFLACLVVLGTWATTAEAQWEPFPWKNVPRLADGSVDMDAPARRTADGHPDLSGFWMPVQAVKHLLDLSADLPPGSVPLRPWAQEVYQERIENNGKDHPGVRCWPSGIPEKNNIPDGLKIVQTPDLMIVLHESRTIYRQIFTDGRPLPRDAQPTWMGYSVGHWEGDTFIVETIGQNGKTWLDMRGLLATEELRVVERFTRPSIGRINIDVTIDDPKAYTKPWDVTLSWRLVPDTDLIESICEENNRDLPHMVGK